MAYEVKYLPIAERDIVHIDEALSQYPNKTKRLFRELDKKLKALENMPYMWPVYQAKPVYRKMVLEDHLLFYTVDETDHLVIVYRVLYDKMDIPKFL